MSAEEYKIHELVFAQGIGVELDERHAPELIELAIMAMNSLPPGWEVGVTSTENGDLPYFFDSKTQSSVWIHPNHLVYCKMIVDKRKELIRAETPPPPSAPETHEEEHLITESALQQHNQLLQSQQNSRAGTVQPQAQDEEIYMYYDEDGEPVVDHYHDAPNAAGNQTHRTEDVDPFMNYEIGPDGELIEVHKEDKHVDIDTVQQTILDMKAKYEQEIAELRNMILKNTTDTVTPTSPQNGNSNALTTTSAATVPSSASAVQVGGPLDTIEERSLESSDTIHLLSKGDGGTGGGSLKSFKSSRSQSRLQYFDEETNSMASDDEDLYSGTAYGIIRDKVSGVVGTVGHVVTSPIRMVANMIVKISPNKTSKTNKSPSGKIKTESGGGASDDMKETMVTSVVASEAVVASEKALLSPAMVPSHKTFNLEDYERQLDDDSPEYGDVAEIPDAVLGHPSHRHPVIHSRSSSSNSSGSGNGNGRTAAGVPNALEIETFLREDIIEGDSESDDGDDNDDTVITEKVPVVEMEVEDQEKYYLGGGGVDGDEDIDYSSLHLQDLADNSKNLFDVFSSGRNTADNSVDEEQQWRQPVRAGRRKTAGVENGEGVEEDEEPQEYGMRVRSSDWDSNRITELTNESHDSSSEGSSLRLRGADHRDPGEEDEEGSPIFGGTTNSHTANNTAGNTPPSATIAAPVTDFDEFGEPIDLLASIRDALNLSPKAKATKVRIQENMIDRSSLDSPTSHSTGGAPSDDMYERYTIDEGSHEDESDSDDGDSGNDRRRHRQHHRSEYMSDAEGDEQDENDADFDTGRFKNVRERLGTPFKGRHKDTEEAVRPLRRTPTNNEEDNDDDNDVRRLPTKSPNQQQDSGDDERGQDTLKKRIDQSEEHDKRTADAGTAEMQNSPVLFPSSNFVKNLMSITDKNKNDMFSLIHFIKQNKNSSDVNIGAFLVGNSAAGSRSGANSKEPSPAKKVEIVYETSQSLEGSRRLKGGGDVLSQFHDIFKSGVNTAEGTREEKRSKQSVGSITQTASITALLQRKHKKVKEAPKEPEWFTIENKYYSTYKKANAAKIAIEDIVIAHYKHQHKKQQQEMLTASQKVNLQRENSEVTVITDNLDSLDSSSSNAQTPAPMPEFLIEIKRDPIRMQWKLECNHYATVQVIHKHYVNLEKARFLHQNHMGQLALSTNHYNATHSVLEKKKSLQGLMQGGGSTNTGSGDENGHGLVESVSDSNVLLLQKKQKVYDAKVVKNRLYKDTKFGSAKSPTHHNSKGEPKLKLPPIK